MLGCLAIASPCAAWSHQKGDADLALFELTTSGVGVFASLHPPAALSPAGKTESSVAGRYAMVYIGGAPC